MIENSNVTACHGAPQGDRLIRSRRGNPTSVGTKNRFVNSQLCIEAVEMPWASRPWLGSQGIGAREVVSRPLSRVHKGPQLVSALHIYQDGGLALSDHEESFAIACKAHIRRCRRGTDERHKASAFSIPEPHLSVDRHGGNPGPGRADDQLGNVALMAPVWSSLPVLASQSLAVLSSDAVAMTRPSPLNVACRIAASCPCRTKISLPVSTFHKRAVASSDPVITSGDTGL